MKEAMLYQRLDGKRVKCALCSHRCLILDGKRGFCGVRENRGGTLYSLVYGKCASWAVDRIEKKPFYHFFPGTDVFSFATVGCNFRCLHCQNFELSQVQEISGEDLSPEQLVKLAKKYRCAGIAYTYTEPTIFFEYANDTAILARKEGMYNVFVTNGYMTPETISEMGNIDASRIDLKSMNDKFYKRICSASLEPVLNSIKLLHKRGHIEIINLVIPTKNDSEEDLRALAKWVAALDKDIPLHFTAFYPANKMLDIPPTPAKLLEKARNIAMEEGLRYAYTGNVPGHDGENTYCPNCKELLIKRFGFDIVDYRITKDKKCPKCGAGIKIITELPKDI